MPDPTPDPVHPPSATDHGAAAGADAGPLDRVAGRSPAAREAVLQVLNELLEAERAGARVARETAQALPPSALAALVQDVHRDEVRWCNLLLRTIQSLEGTASSATGAFWGKAMAIPDLEQRLQFLNRGQAWVVRKLEALIPQVEDAAIRDGLTLMLDAHRTNIARVEACPRTGAGEAQA